MKVCIIGGGNIGTLLASDFSRAGFETVLLTSKGSETVTEITVFNDSYKNTRYSTVKISKDIENSLENAKLIIFTYPAHILHMKKDLYIPYIEEGVFIGFMPGSGGAEFAFEALIEKNCFIFGFERVHAIARLGDWPCVCELDRKSHVVIGALSNNKKKLIQLQKMLKHGLDMPIKTVNNYLTITLTPSNPILHTSRIYDIFNNYEKHHKFDSDILFYEDWSNHASKLLLQCDDELQSICNHLLGLGLDVTGVASLKDHYEVKDASEMTRKIRSIPAFRDIKAPLIESNKGFYLDQDSRYFKEDFDYGLLIIKYIAFVLNKDTPGIDLILKWYSQLFDKDFYFKNDFNPYNEVIKKIGLDKITSETDLIKFYEKGRLKCKH